VRLEFLDSCINDLKEEERYAIVAFFFRKVKVRELARVYNITYDGAKKRVDRAVMALEKRYFLIKTL